MCAKALVAHLLRISFQNLSLYGWQQSYIIMHWKSLCMWAKSRSVSRSHFLLKSSGQLISFWVMLLWLRLKAVPLWSKCSSLPNLLIIMHLVREPQDCPKRYTDCFLAWQSTSCARTSSTRTPGIKYKYVPSHESWQTRTTIYWWCLCIWAKSRPVLQIRPIWVNQLSLDQLYSSYHYRGSN